MLPSQGDLANHGDGGSLIAMMLIIPLLVEYIMMIMWKVNSRITEVVADLAERERTREGETREAEARSR